MKRGFTLIETIVYAAILAVLSVAVIATILSMTSAFAKAKILRRLTLDAETVLERVSRDARSASAVDDAASVLNASSSRLSLDTGNNFYISGGRVAFQQNGGVVDYLTSPTSSTTSFFVTKITTARSEAVKIQLTLSAGSGEGQITRSFFSTVILR